MSLESMWHHPADSWKCGSGIRGRGQSRRQSAEWWVFGIEVRVEPEKWMRWLRARGEIRWPRAVRPGSCCLWLEGGKGTPQNESYRGGLRREGERKNGGLPRRGGGPGERRLAEPRSPGDRRVVIFHIKEVIGHKRVLTGKRQIPEC